MENLGFIDSVRINDLILFQYIDLNNDSVVFKNDENNKTIFIIDRDGYCTFVKDDKNISVGKFGFDEKYFIKFTTDIIFLSNNPVFNTTFIRTLTKDFIIAERVIIEQFLSNHGNIFK